MVWQLSKTDLPKEAILRPYVMLRLVSDKDLNESQVGLYSYGLHNPTAGLPCVSCKAFTVLGDVAIPLDKKIKKDGEAIIECSKCKAVHVLTTRGAPEGWVELTRPL